MHWNVFWPTWLSRMVIIIPGQIREIVDCAFQGLIGAQNFAAMLSQSLDALIFWFTSIKLVGSILLWGSVGMGFIWPIILPNIDVVWICDRLYNFRKFVTIRFQITVRADIFFIVSWTELKGLLTADLFIDKFSVCLVRLCLHYASISGKALLHLWDLIWPATHLPYCLRVEPSDLCRLVSSLGMLLLSPIIIVPDRFLLDE